MTVAPFTLETRGLGVNFGGHAAVSDVTCTFRPGELTAIVGPNGAGKTTFFNLISGQVQASAGSLHLAGRDISRLTAPARARAGIGRAFQLTNLFPRLSVHENVRLAVQARAGVHYAATRPWRLYDDLARDADALLTDVALEARRDALAGDLPHGDQRKLEVALLMALHPRVYMFDEPTAGMNGAEAPVVLDLIARLKHEGSAIILLVEHKMDVVASLADRIVVLHNGRLVADGAPAAIIASPIVQEAYLGLPAGRQAAA